MQIAAKSRRGTLRPPRPTFAAHPSPDFPKQAREGANKSAANAPAAPAPPAAPLPPPLLPSLSQGTQGVSQGTQGLSTQNTSPGTLEGQASRPLSTPPTFPCGRDSPRTPTQEIGNTNSLGDRALRRGTPGVVKVGTHDSPDRAPVESASQRSARSRSLLRQPSRTKSSTKRMLATSTMSDASSDAAVVRAAAAAQAAAASQPVTVLNATAPRPTSRMWLPCISAPRTIDEGGSESVHNGGVTTGATSAASRSQNGGHKGSAASSSSQVASGNGQVSLFKWGLRMSCL